MFDSIGARTLICISALDITRTEFDTPEDRRRKWACAMAGFAAMAVLAIWLLPSHGPPQGPGQDARHGTRAAAGILRRPRVTGQGVVLPRVAEIRLAARADAAVGNPGPSARAFGRSGSASRGPMADAGNMNARFLHRATGDGGAARPDHERTGPARDTVTAARAGCCPARPVVRVIMPPTPARPHETELLLCGHHYRVSRKALAKAQASVYRLPGPDGAEPAALIPDLPESRVPVS